MRIGPAFGRKIERHAVEGRTCAATDHPFHAFTLHFVVDMDMAHKDVIDPVFFDDLDQGLRALVKGIKPKDILGRGDA
jgi:hypothetical protein